MSHELVFEGVTTSFDDSAALKDVSFSVMSGGRVAIIGPLGAEKTALLRLANGSIAPDSGRVTLDGTPVTGGRVALAYQEETLVGRRTALANVLVGRIGALPWWRGFVEPLVPVTPDPALDLLAAMGIAEKAAVRADSLSAGERQRVAFARGLVQDTPVLLADEPTRSLDPSTRDTVLSLLDSVGDRMLVTVLHDTDLAREQAERIIGVADGRVQFDRSTHAVTEELLCDHFGSEGDHRGVRPRGAERFPLRATPNATHIRV